MRLQRVRAGVLATADGLFKVWRDAGRWTVYDRQLDHHKRLPTLREVREFVRIAGHYCRPRR